MKKTLKMLVAALMVMVLAAVTPLQSYAAEKKTYISDLQVIYASSYDEAKKQASDGYTVINQKMDGKEGVWLSYKSTTNKDEAITDISVMNMNGGWSYEAFDKLLKEKKEEIENYVQQLMVAVEGYRENYQSKQPAAVFAHDVLNRIIDDDTNMGLGDLLLSSDAQTRLNTIVLESSALVTDTMLTYLGIANDGDWVSNVDLAEEITDPSATERVDKLYELLPDLYEGFKAYEACGIDLKNATEDEINEYLANTSAAEGLTNLSYGTAYEVLSVENPELLDLFNQDPETIDKSELVPVAAAMNDALMECIDSLGLAKAISYSGVTEENIETVKKLSVYQETETISVYAGVDRSIYEGDGIAMTSEAIRSYTTSSGSSSNNYDKAFKGLMIAAAAAGAAAIIAGVATVCAYQAAKVQLSYVVTVMEDNLMGPTGTPMISNAQAFISCNSIGSKIIHIGGSVVAVLVAVAVLCVLAATLLKIATKDKRDVKYTSIPRIIISEEVLEDKEYLFAYRAVTDTSGTKYADLNNWTGSQWNVLYYTKDTDAGNPLTTTYFTGSDTAKMSRTKTYTVAHPFGSTAAFNLNAFHFDKQDALYLAFVQDTSASGSTAAATSLSATGYAITAVAGIAVGALATWLAERAISRKKKAAKA